MHGVVVGETLIDDAEPLIPHAHPEFEESDGEGGGLSVLPLSYV